MKRKYLHIEIRDGSLYVFSDDKTWKGKKLTLEDMDTECNITDTNKRVHFYIPLEDFVL